MIINTGSGFGSLHHADMDSGVKFARQLPGVIA